MVKVMVEVAFKVDDKESLLFNARLRIAQTSYLSSIFEASKSVLMSSLVSYCMYSILLLKSCD